MTIFRKAGTRFRTFAAASAFGLGLALASAASAAEIVLRADVTVDNGLVTLGDLLSDAGDKAGIAVFRAPDIGKSGKVSASRVVEAAASHGLRIAPGGIHKVTVRRDSRTVTESDVMAALNKAVAATELGRSADTVTVRLSQSLATAHLAPTRTAPLEIRSLSITPRSGRFSAVVSVEDATGEPSPVMRVRGIAEMMVNVPVLNRTTERGQPLSAADFTMEMRPQGSIPRDAASLQDVAGMAIKRRMSAGSFVTLSDLTEPVLIERNEIVTMIFRVGRLQLTTRGRALSEGSKGGIVPVMNLESKRIIDAEIMGDGIVSVAPNSQPLQIAQNGAVR